MLNITREAAARFERMLQALAASRRESLRIQTVAGGVDFWIDEVRPGDQKVPYADRTVFVYDRQTAARLAGRTIDVQTTPEGEMLIIN
jgi:Fe-S cluster assembly iron-binding protein IscA